MRRIHSGSPFDKEKKELAADCTHCCGLCCVALYFSKCDGFPENKAAGKPCKHLTADFRCDIHPQLYRRGLKGCLSYDCFGAGQKAARLYHGDGFQSSPELAGELFEVFLTLCRLQQLLWYLIEAASLLPAKAVLSDIGIMIDKTKQLTGLPAEQLLSADLDEHDKKGKALLKQVSRLVQSEWEGSFQNNSGKQLLGKNFKGKLLNGADFTMSLLIASNFEGCSLNGANFLGADLRDANFQSADLRESIFLTQGQINTAIGNKNTKLPDGLIRPVTWEI